MFEAGSLDEGTSDQDFVTKLAFSANGWRPAKVLSAESEAVDGLGIWQPLELDSCQREEATRTVEVATSMLSQLDERGVPVDPQHPPNVLVFLQLSLAIPAEEWQKPASELVRMLNTGPNVLLGPEQGALRVSRHADTSTDPRDALRLDRQIRRTAQIPAPAAGGGPRQPDRLRKRRLELLQQAFDETRLPGWPRPRYSDVYSQYLRGSEASPGGRWRRLLTDEGDASQISLKTVTRYMKELKLEP